MKKKYEILENARVLANEIVQKRRRLTNTRGEMEEVRNDILTKQIIRNCESLIELMRGFKDAPRP